MKKLHKYSGLLLFIAVFFYFNTALAQCHSSADLSTMNSNFLYFLKNLNQKQNNKIIVLPLHDNSLIKANEDLAVGIPFLIYDAFAPATPSLMHPYLAMNSLKNLGIAGEELAQTETAKKTAHDRGARFVIFGSFQHTSQNNIRVLINVYDAKTDKTLSPAQTFESTEDDSFLDLVLNHVSNAFSRIPSAPKLKAEKITTPGMQAFIYLTKGLVLSDQYDLTKLKLASLWFEKALKERYHKNNQAALHLARTYFMMALVQKLNKTDFTTNWQAGLGTLKYLTASENNSAPYLLSFRFVKAHSLALKALTAAMNNNTALTQKLSFDGLKLVPEDGIMQTLYMNSAGNKKHNEIVTNNPICL